MNSPYSCMLDPGSDVVPRNDSFAEGLDGPFLFPFFIEQYDAASRTAYDNSYRPTFLAAAR